MALERLALGLLVGVVAVQPNVARQPAGPDPIPALLAEVHELRIVMERAATVGPRIQLLTSRMTLQDERVFRIARQTESLRDELDRIVVQRKEFATRAKQLEDLIVSETDPQKRRDLEDAQRFLKSEVETQTAREQLLQNRQAESVNMLALEQAQWNELVQRLDELERALEKR